MGQWIADHLGTAVVILLALMLVRYVFKESKKQREIDKFFADYRVALKELGIEEPLMPREFRERALEHKVGPWPARFALTMAIDYAIEQWSDSHDSANDCATKLLDILAISRNWIGNSIGNRIAAPHWDAAQRKVQRAINDIARFYELTERDDLMWPKMTSMYSAPRWDDLGELGPSELRRISRNIWGLNVLLTGTSRFRRQMEELGTRELQAHELRSISHAFVSTGILPNYLRVAADGEISCYLKSMQK